MGYLINIDTAIKVSQDLKKQGKNIVFTHGAFDLFHAGHSLFLNKSKKEGDILIVGIDPDKNIKKYKSRLRPIINEKHRVEIVANHMATDFTFLIDEVDNINSHFYIEFYKAIKPSVITLGQKSFANVDLSEREKEVGKFNAEIRKLDAEVTSTTKIISSIVNSYK